MAPKSLAEQIAELDDPTPKDYDPEDIERDGPSDSDEEGGADADASAGREHYQAVGKGKLRKQDPINLGKQYAGSKVSRDALEADSDDDPFKARGSDGESEEDSEDDEDEEGIELGSDEEDEDISESEEERPKKSKDTGKKAKKQVDFDEMDTEGSEDEELDEDELDEEMPSDEDEEEEEDDEDEDDDDEDEDDEDEKPSKPRVKFDKPATSDDRDELRRLMASDQKTIAATISQAAKTDATKGKAVKQQRATFDALLNTRIKLQKGLTAINQLSIAAKDNTEEDTDGEAIKSAESAALALWSTLEDLRLALADAQSQDDDSKKRKRPAAASPATSSASLWKRMADLESSSVSHRRAILDKWSLKIRGANSTTPNARGKLLGSATGAGQQTITAVLDAQVASETSDRASKRARKTTSAEADSEPAYDDTVFYQSLLRNLVEQRMSSDAVTGGMETLHIQQLPSRLSVHPVTGMRNDKVKREIDTRASKGRKMRYDVHEKLQNFMAPEDRGSWTSTAREEFFASLLGKTASGLLGEDDDSGAESEEDREEGGLRLFRG